MARAPRRHFALNVVGILSGIAAKTIPWTLLCL